MKYTRLSVLLLIILSLAMAAPATAAGGEQIQVRRFALIIGANVGGGDRVKLAWAHSDAKAMSRVLASLGGVEAEDVLMLLDPSRQDLEQGFRTLSERINAGKNPGVRVETIFYYSGHSDEEGLLLKGDHFLYREIRAALEQQRADVRIAMLDSCASGALTRGKGGKWRAPFLVDSSSQVRGHAFLTAASADEAAQESERIQGSFFTHYMISGLRGAADVSHDGRVTLNEAYQYAFHETLGRTEATMSGPQHPSYDFQLSGAGDLVLTDLRKTSAMLVFPAALEARIFVREPDGTLVAEINKIGGRDMSFGMEPGEYVISAQTTEGVRQGRITLSSGQEALVDLAVLDQVPVEVTTRRGDSQKSIIPILGAEYEEPVLENYLILPASISLVPGLSTNAAASRPVLNHFSLNLLLDWTDALSGFEMSGVAGIRKEWVRGVQAAGAINMAGSWVHGVQGAGAVNLAGGELLGVQGAGAVNFAAGSVRGLQGAGGVNISGAGMKGFQGAGGANITLGEMVGVQAGSINYAQSLRGLQAAAVNIAGSEASGLQAAAVNYTGDGRGLQVSAVNLAAGEYRGAQIGAVNYASKVTGTQIGAINVAGEMSGVPIGVINYVGNGLLVPSLWTDENLDIGLGLKMGSKTFYSILGVAFNPQEDKAPFSTIFGLGGHLSFGRIWVDLDLVQHQLHDDWKWDNHLDLVHKFRAQIGFRILDELSIFAGPTLNFLLSTKRDTYGFDYNLWTYTETENQWNVTNNQKADIHLALSPGLLIGLEFHPQLGALNRD